MLHIPLNSFPYKKHNESHVVTPQEVRVCGESNEINGEKIVLGSTAEKKNFLLLIRSEKIVCLSWQLKKLKP